MSNASELTEQEVADLLRMSRRWLQQRLKEDAERDEPQLQFHHWIGASRRWTWEAYCDFREAIMRQSAERKNRPRRAGIKSRPSPITYSAPGGVGAYDKVLNYRVAKREGARKRTVRSETE